MILLIPIAYNNSRKVAELFEGQEFKNKSELDEALRKELMSPEKDGDKAVMNDIEQPSWYTLSEFAQQVNDEDMDDLTGYFISYIHLGE